MWATAVRTQAPVKWSISNCGNWVSDRQRPVDEAPKLLIPALDRIREGCGDHAGPRNHHRYSGCSSVQIDPRSALVMNPSASTRGAVKICSMLVNETMFACGASDRSVASTDDTGRSPTEWDRAHARTEAHVELGPAMIEDHERQRLVQE